VLLTALDAEGLCAVFLASDMSRYITGEVINISRRRRYDPVTVRLSGHRTLR
jgi:hypothetical protein